MSKYCSPRQFWQRLLLGAIVLSGLMAISVYGDNTYFGVIHVEGINMLMILPAIMAALS